MKINKTALVELALGQVDNAGALLDRAGYSNGLNRHNLLSLAFDQQQRAQGIKDSLQARVGSQVARTRNTLDKLAERGAQHKDSLTEHLASVELLRMNAIHAKAQISDRLLATVQTLLPGLQRNA